ncbi:MAG TPA: YCF48-related protein [Candidatus Nanoarchaeia archaeon]|nr:YCF48-related protein [Candidatus Nanoarchaeia archaeon]
MQNKKLISIVQLVLLFISISIIGFAASDFTLDNESNDKKIEDPQQINLPQKPIPREIDLTLSNARILENSILLEGETIYLLVDLEYQGSSPINNVNFRLQKGIPGDEVSFNIPSMNPGETRVIALNWEYQNYGNYLIIATVDPFNEFREINEENNQENIQLTISCIDDCDPDININTCNELFTPQNYFIGHQEETFDDVYYPACCGDDVFEKKSTQVCDGSKVDCINDNNIIACCNIEENPIDYAGRHRDDCTDGSKCFSVGGNTDINNDDNTEVCLDGRWMDPDESIQHCGLFDETCDAQEYYSNPSVCGDTKSWNYEGEPNILSQNFYGPWQNDMPLTGFIQIDPEREYTITIEGRVINIVGNSVGISISVYDGNKAFIRSNNLNNLILTPSQNGQGWRTLSTSIDTWKGYNDIDINTGWPQNTYYAKFSSYRQVTQGNNEWRDLRLEILPGEFLRQQVSCCGDDSNEFLKCNPLQPSQCICCSDSSDKYINGACAKTCSDGTAQNTCVFNQKPLKCDYQNNLVNDCQQCGCANGLVCDQESKHCVPQESNLADEYYFNKCLIDKTSFLCDKIENPEKKRLAFNVLASTILDSRYCRFSNPDFNYCAIKVNSIIDRALPQWQQISQPLANTELLAIEFIDENTVFAVGRDGYIFRSSDGGFRWRRMNSNTNIDLFDIDFFDELNGVAVGTSRNILKSSDGGLNWHEEDIGMPSEVQLIRQVQLFWYDSIGYLGAASSIDGVIIMKSDNNGASWTTICCQGMNPAIRGFWDFDFTGTPATPTFGGWMAATNQDLTRIKVFHTNGEPYSNNWQEIFELPSSNLIYDISAVGALAGQAWFSSNRGIYHAVWNELGYTLQYTGPWGFGIYDVEFTYPSFGLAAGRRTYGGQVVMQNPVLTTIDGGQTWQSTDLSVLRYTTDVFYGADVKVTSAPKLWLLTGSGGYITSYERYE